MALVVGCGDDDPGSDGGEGGDGGETAGSSSGGSGKAGGNTAGSSNDAGMSNPDPIGGAGGGDTDPPVGGDGGAITGGGGEGGGPDTFAEITEVDDNIYTQVSDLRGLRFSTIDNSNKLWASGHKGIIPNPATLADPDKVVVVARFLPNGLPDTTFGGDGFIELNLTPRVINTTPEPDEVTNDGNEDSLGIVELANGDVVVAANRRDAAGKGMDAVLVRLNSAGEYVNTFGVQGVATLTFGWPAAEDATFPSAPAAAPSDTTWGLEVDSSTVGTEKLVVFGLGSAAKGQMTTGNAPVQRTDNDRYVTRVLATTGAIDPGFNNGAAFFYNSGGIFGDNARRGIVEADGSILSAGYVNLGESLGNHIVAIRLLPSGTRDMTFGHGVSAKGVIRSNPLINDGGVAECYNLVRQADGRIITTGYGAATGAGIASSFGYATTTAPDLVSFAFTADGKAIDDTFGNAGMFIAQSEGTPLLTRFEERGRDMDILADQRLVYAGNYGEDPAIFVATPDGDFDPQNGIGNLFTYEPLPLNGTSTSHFFRVVASPDGSLIAASTSQNAAGVLLAILKVGE
ncbi:MAG TPA: hypothetical protein VJN18_14710 [Polyangiaceae bacterium]|nr:hypothetical protein [Polyangiaceae bacterium]